MHRRPRLSRRPARRRLAVGLLALAAALPLSGCSHTVSAKVPLHGSDPACTRLSTLLPARLLPGTALAAARRQTDPASPALRAWGSPAIILRCGVEPPGPTAVGCQSVDGIDWVVDQLPDGVDFTTYGRSPAVQVLVPSHYAPEAFVLTGLSGAVASIPQGVHRCS